MAVALTATEFDRLTNVTGTAAAGAANEAIVTMTLKNMNGFAKPGVFDVYLSDSAAGTGLTGTAASGAVAISSKGVIIDTQVAKKAFTVQTDANGVVDLSITDTGKTAYSVIAVIGGREILVVTLATASYG